VTIDARAAAGHWASTWERAWRERDVDVIIALYAEDASFRSHPLRDELRGPDGVRSYVAAAFADEETVEPWFAVRLADGTRALVEWAATLVEAGEEITLTGCSLLEFDDTGRCTAQRDYWAQGPGRRVLPWQG
jgi:hypothetical protein